MLAVQSLYRLAIRPEDVDPKLTQLFFLDMLTRGVCLPYPERSQMPLPNHAPECDAPIAAVQGFMSAHRPLRAA